MLNKPKEKLPLLLLCWWFSLLIIIKENISATSSRINGLGVQNWMLVEDDTLIWLFPSEINNYRNIFLYELGTGVAPAVDNNLKLSSPWGGISVSGGFIKKSVISFFIARPYVLLLPITPGEDITGSDLSPIPKIPTKNVNFSMLLPNNKFDIFYGFLVKDVKGGIYFNFSENSIYDKDSLVSEPPSPNDTLSESRLSSLELTLSLGINIDNFIVQKTGIALSSMIKFPAAKNTYLTYKGENKNIKISDWVFRLNPGLNLDIKARVVRPFLNDKLSLLGYLRFYTLNEDNVYTRKEDENNDGDYEDTRDVNYMQKRSQNTTGAMAGVAVNHFLPQEFLVIAGIGVSNVSLQHKGLREQMKVSLSGKDQEYQQEMNIFSIPLNIAIEKNFYMKKNSLSLRLGLSHALHSTTEIKTKDPDWQLAAGLPNRVTGVVSSTNFTSSTGPTQLSIGIGVDLGRRLALDFVLREHVVFTGTYILSGIPESLFSQGSLICRF